MKKSIMKKWVAALRSGEFKQIKGRLETSNGNCCLGVLCNLALIEGVCDFTKGEDINFYDDRSGLLPPSVMEWAKIKSNNGIIPNKYYLTTLNDEGYSFNEIADIIEENYKSL